MLSPVISVKCHISSFLAWSNQLARPKLATLNGGNWAMYYHEVLTFLRLPLKDEWILL